MDSHKNTGKSKFKCSHKGCNHLTTFLDWCATNGWTEEAVSDALDGEDDMHPSQSFRKIPYPLTDRLKCTHDSLESGKQHFPIRLLPPMESSTCKHVLCCNKKIVFVSFFFFFPRGPVEQGWLAGESATIYKFSITIKQPERKVYYRPTVGSCSFRYK